MRRLFIILVATFLLFVPATSIFAGGEQEIPEEASKEPAPAAPTAAKYTFYFMSVAPGVDPFFAVIYKGVEAAEAVFPVDVRYVGLMAEEISATSFVDKLETARGAKPDGIITGFWWREAEEEVCRKAIEEGIPIIAFNTEDPRPIPEKIPYLGYVGMDERMTGEILARRTLDQFDIKRTVIGIHAPGTSALETRAAGIVKVLDEKGIPYEKLDTTMTPSTIMTVLGAYLMKYPETNHIFLLGPSSTHPALQLLEEQNLKGKVFISTVDVSEQIIEGIEKGTILMTISQQPFAQSFLAIAHMYTYLEYGILPPERTQTGPTMIDKSNVQVIKKQIEMTGGG